MVDQAYDDITTAGFGTDGAGEFGSPISKRVEHRSFVFRNSVAWTEYQARFGGGDMLSSIIGEIDKLARDTAQIEVLGPYPRATLQAMKAAVDRDRAAAGKPTGGHGFLEAVFDRVTGKAHVADNPAVASAFQSVRNLITAARLGSAIFTSLSDFGSSRITARMNGLPHAKVLGEYFRQLNPANPAHRRQAARLGYVAETWLGDLVAAQRIMGEVTGAARTAKIADTSLRLSGLTAHTEGLRNAFKISYVGHLTEQATMPWQRIDATARKAMERYGITEADWNLYRDTPVFTDPETGATFIRPEDVWLEYQDVRLASVERDARFAASQKFNDLISTEAKFAVIEPTARSQALLFRRTAPGDIPGEVLRSITQFKSFLATFNYMHGARGLAQQDVSNKLLYATGLIIPMTLAGAVAEQASAITRGQMPRDMDPTSEEGLKFWASAFARGGSLGPIGDFMFSDRSRHGHGFLASTAGPLAGQAETLLKIGKGAIDGDNVTNDLRRFAQGFLPGGSLWYLRTAIERTVLDQIEEAADPKARQRFQRAERKQRKEFGNGMWWRRGEALPN